MYLNSSGVHVKHFSLLNHSLLESTAHTNRVQMFFGNKITTKSAHPKLKTVHTEWYLCAEYRSKDVSRWRFACTLYAQFHLINAIIRSLLGLFKFQYIRNFHESSGKKNYASSPNIFRQQTMFRFYSIFGCFSRKKKVSTKCFVGIFPNNVQLKRRLREKSRKNEGKNHKKFHCSSFRAQVFSYPH